MYRFLIYGGKNWIHDFLIDSIYNMGIVDVKLSQINTYLPNEIYNEITQIKPSHILCLIDKTTELSQYYTQSDINQNTNNIHLQLEQNLYIPILLGNITRELNIHFTYINICNFYNYNPANPLYAFTENDYPNFNNNIFSMVNGYTDVLLKTYINVLNIRIKTPICYLALGNEFLSELVKTKDVYDITESFSVLDDIIPVILDMSIQRKTGTYNLANSGYISHKDILEIYKSEIDMNHTYTSNNFNNYIKKTNNSIPHCILDTSKIYELYPDIPDIRTSIKNVLRKSI